jgi:hypothetical protein
MRSIIIFYIISYRLLGELGAAGLRAPPQSVGDPQPDLDNASEGKASKREIARECIPSLGRHSTHPGIRASPSALLFPMNSVAFVLGTMEVEYAL